ncbi:hypothetical protein EOL73_00010 [Candidatus Saccharibacteria bacterium]|nr:hypothetical protein [Candidatus Saccharibacteria bacterium]
MKYFIKSNKTGNFLSDPEKEGEERFTEKMPMIGRVEFYTKKSIAENIAEFVGGYVVAMDIPNRSKKEFFAERKRKQDKGFKMKAQNMVNTNGNAIPNQFIIKHGKAEYFQSYNSVIAKRENGKVFLDYKYWDYSRTTGKYRNLFLNETKKETQAKIDNGEYILTDLNN